MYNYKVGDKVIMKAPRKNSSTGYAETAGRVLTIKTILPQYENACTFKEIGPSSLFRLRDILRKLDLQAGAKR